MDKKKILVIDDEPSFTEMLKLNLEETGRFFVKCVNDPHQALETALLFLPDLILLDVIMPDIEGPDVLSMLKEEPLLRNIPIIFLTATVRKDEASEDDGLIGGHLFLAKPCSLSELINAIDDHI